MPVSHQQADRKTACSTALLSQKYGSPIHVSHRACCAAVEQIAATMILERAVAKTARKKKKQQTWEQEHNDKHPAGVLCGNWRGWRRLKRADSNHIWKVMGVDVIPTACLLFSFSRCERLESAALWRWRSMERYFLEKTTQKSSSVFVLDDKFRHYDCSFTFYIYIVQFCFRRTSTCNLSLVRDPLISYRDSRRSQ